MEVGEGGQIRSGFTFIATHSAHVSTHETKIVGIEMRLIICFRSGRCSYTYFGAILFSRV